MTLSDDDPRLCGQQDVFARVERRVADDDTMYAGHEEHYFGVGASALAIVRRALDVARIDEGDVARILDYACGYGRVLRWLRAAFPEAVIHGVDAHAPSIEAAHTLGLADSIVQLDISLERDLGASFDLIWVGSLFTHLSAADTQRGVAYLRRHLSPKGVLIVTTHGEFVHERLITGAADYALTPESVAQVITGYDSIGYGYADYWNSTTFGISVTRAARMTEILLAAGLMPFMFQPAEWDRHQDVFACRRVDWPIGRGVPTEVTG